jgi:hypothetical protein
MIVDFHVKIIYLIKTYAETAVIPVCQEHAFSRKNFGFCHAVHKIEIPYIHKEVLSVLTRVPII